MKKTAGIFVLCMIASMFFALTCPAADEFPAPGEWSSVMRDKGETGWSPGKGNITNPGFSKLFYAGVTDYYVVVRPQQGVKDNNSAAIAPVNLPAGKAKFTDDVFDLNPPLADGESIMAFPQDMKGVSFAFGDFLKDVDGLECAALDSAFSAPTDKHGNYQKVMVRGYKFQDGKAAQVWEYGPVSNLFIGNPIVGDFDADGNVELAMTPWYKVVLIDAATGRLKDECEFSKGRNYGYFSAYDLNGDGKKEFIILSDFSKHLDVCGFGAGGKLQVLWQKEIEASLVEPKRQVRVNPFCVADVNGDGRLDIVVTLFNPPALAGFSADDDRWHVVVFDGMKGNVLADYCDQYLAGIADLDNDGASEILTQSANKVSTVGYGKARVHAIRGSKSVLLWEKDKACWQIFDPQVLGPINAPIQRDVYCISGKDGKIMNAWTKRPNGWVKWQPGMDYQVKNGATRPNENLLFRNFADGAAVVLKEPGNTPTETKLDLLQWRNNSFDIIAEVSGRSLTAIAIGKDKSVLIRSGKGAKGEKLSFSHARLELIAEGKRAPFADVVAIGINNDGKVIGVKQGASDEEEIIAFEMPREKGKEAVELWRSKGRFQTTSWPMTLGGTISDLNLDGKREVIFAYADEKTGCGKITVADLASGIVIWQQVFENIPGTAPVWNSGGVTLWKTGNFTSRNRQDVLVSVRRNIMGSDETYLLSGEDGKVLWHRVGEKLNGRGSGGAIFAVADYNKDGYDEAATLYQDILYILDGKTGQDDVLEEVRKLRNHPDPGGAGYWGQGVAAKFLNNDDDLIFFYTPSQTLTGLIRPDFKNKNAEFVWTDALGETNIIHPAIGDFDGDGQLEAVCFKYKDGVRCYDTANGKIKWKNTDMVKPSSVVTADIDGDGRCEAIAVLNDKIFCIGNNEVKWNIQMPCTVGQPSLADIRGRGLLSIVVAGTDGNIYTVEQK